MNRGVSCGLVITLAACSTAERQLPADARGDNPAVDASEGGSTSDGPAGSIDAPASTTCGNGVMNNGEACDDNNAASNDGCSSTCALEATQAVTAMALNLSVTDDGYNGTLGSMTCANVAVSAWYTPTIAGTTIVFGMDHAWIGDLTIKAVAPDNTVVTLVSRPGVVEAADDGTTPGGFGTGADFAKASPITFDTGAATSAESMGVGLATVCASNNVCTFAPNAGAATAGTLANFNGKASTGTWKLCVGDGSSGDTGKIDRVTFTFAH